MTYACGRSKKYPPHYNAFHVAAFNVRMREVRLRFTTNMVVLTSDHVYNFEDAIFKAGRQVKAFATSVQVVGIQT